MFDFPFKLNLGCGIKKFHLAGWVNIDNNPACDPDFRFDVSVAPWPRVETNSVIEIKADNLLEHIGWGPLGEDLLAAFMNEAHRVLLPDGKLWFKVPDVELWPYGAFRDPTHRRFFTAGSPDYWNGNHHTHQNYGKSYGYLPWVIHRIERVATPSKQHFLEVTQSPMKESA